MSNFRPLQIEDIPEGSERGSLAESETTEVAARRDADIVMSGGMIRSLRDCRVGKPDG